MGNINRLSHIKQIWILLVLFPYLRKPKLGYFFFLLNIKNIWLHKQPKVVICFVSILKVRIVAHEHTGWILLVSHNGAQAGIALDILVQKKCQACTHPLTEVQIKQSRLDKLITSFVHSRMAAMEICLILYIINARAERATEKATSIVFLL